MSLSNALCITQNGLASFFQKTAVFMLKLGQARDPYFIFHWYFYIELSRQTFDKWYHHGSLNEDFHWWRSGYSERKVMEKRFINYAQHRQALQARLRGKFLKYFTSRNICFSVFCNLTRFPQIPRKIPLFCNDQQTSLQYEIIRYFIYLLFRISFFNFL